MFTPTTFGTALLMMIVSAACWGSWANTYKGVKNYRFELFYWDYASGNFSRRPDVRAHHGLHERRPCQFSSIMSAPPTSPTSAGPCWPA